MADTTVLDDLTARIKVALEDNLEPSAEIIRRFVQEIDQITLSSGEMLETLKYWQNKNQASFDEFLDGLRDNQANLYTWLVEMRELHTDTVASANAATGAVNYKGAWSSAVGAGVQGTSYSHNGSEWTLLVNLADISSVPPSLSNSTTWRRVASSIRYAEWSSLTGTQQAGLIVEFADTKWVLLSDVNDVSEAQPTVGSTLWGSVGDILDIVSFKYGIDKQSIFVLGVSTSLSSTHSYAYNPSNKTVYKIYQPTNGVINITSITDNEIVYNIPPSSTQMYMKPIRERKILPLSKVGCVSGVDNSKAINYAFSNASIIEIDDDYEFSDISIPLGARVHGLGRLIGLNSNSTKPTIESLRNTDNPDQRLSILQNYNRNKVTLTGTSGYMKGSLYIENALIVSDNSSVTYIVRGDVTLVNCSMYGIALRPRCTGRVYADNLINTDSPADGIRPEIGGIFEGDNVLVYGSSIDNIYPFVGGVFYSNGVKSYNAGRMNFHANVGGVALLQNFDFRYANNQNMSLEVSSAVVGNNGYLGDSVGSVGAACEHSSGLHLEGTTIVNNPLSPLTTSYNGFIQAKNCTITNNGKSIATETGGVITVLGSEVHDNNNGGVQMEAKSLGFIISEPAGKAGSGKQTLTDSQYSPSYGIMGNGMGMIYDSESESLFPLDNIGISSSKEVYTKRIHDVVNGTIYVSSGLVRVDTSSEDVVLTQINMSTNFSTERVIIQSTSVDHTLTIRSGVGNIRLDNDIVLTGVNDIVVLYKTGFIDRWTTPKS